MPPPSSARHQLADVGRVEVRADVRGLHPVGRGRAGEPDQWPTTAAADEHELERVRAEHQAGVVAQPHPLAEGPPELAAAAARREHVEHADAEGHERPAGRSPTGALCTSASDEDDRGEDAGVGLEELEPEDVQTASTRWPKVGSRATPPRRRPG